MKYQKIFFITFLLCFVFSVSTKSAAKNNWVRVHSKNFNLIGDASEKDIRAVAVTLEKFRET
ncbi:MAG TPA: hypothetical protein VK308_05320, partial [Pyrinomonadaceae bacterium]|nr:hypothetical protein [Pyrinomonadaceae bacterium]